jgi:hypothetical protein
MVFSKLLKFFFNEQPEVTEPILVGQYLTENDSIPYFNGTESTLHPGQPIRLVTQSLNDGNVYEEVLISLKAIPPQQSGTLVRNWVARFPVHESNNDIIQVGDLVHFDTELTNEQNPLGTATLSTSGTYLGRAILGYNNLVPTLNNLQPVARAPGQSWVDVEYFPKVYETTTSPRLPLQLSFTHETALVDTVNVTIFRQHGQIVEGVDYATDAITVDVTISNGQTISVEIPENELSVTVPILFGSEAVYEVTLSHPNAVDFTNTIDVRNPLYLTIQFDIVPSTNESGNIIVTRFDGHIFEGIDLKEDPILITVTNSDSNLLVVPATGQFGFQENILLIPISTLDIGNVTVTVEHIPSGISAEATLTIL